MGNSIVVHEFFMDCIKSAYCGDSFHSVVFALALGRVFPCLESQFSWLVCMYVSVYVCVCVCKSFFKHVSVCVHEF